MKLVRGFGGRYSVTKDGRIWSHPGKTKRWARGRFLKPMACTKGYHKVTLYKGKKGVQLLVHRIVAIAYVPNLKKLEETNHKNGVKTDNRSSNIEWCTSSGNKRHGEAMGLYKRAKNGRYITVHR